MIPHLVHLPSSQFAKTSQWMWTCEPVDLVVSDSVWFLFDLGWGWCIYIQSKWFSWEMMDWHFTTLRFSHEHPWTNSKGYGRKNGISAFLSQCGIIIIIWIKIPGSQTETSEIILTLSFTLYTLPTFLLSFLPPLPNIQGVQNSSINNFLVDYFDKVTFFKLQTDTL